MDTKDLETINKIADYRCRKYYEMLLEALIIIVTGTIIGLGVSQIPLSTPLSTPNDTKIQENNTSATSEKTPSTPNNIPSGQWVKPLDRLSITSPFGMRLHPTLKTYRPHNGTDFSGRVGTPLYSMSTGSVLRTISDSACGLGLVIQHPDSITSHYCHLNKVSVKAGQSLKAGQRIGDVGNTGRSTGPHLHLGIKRSGSWINPVPFMKSKGIL
jgi:murein DD-endopeptidase MepM/ murein hydrolase activator NlpD